MELVASRFAIGPRPRRGGPVPRVLSLHPRPLPAPPLPALWSSEVQVEAQAGSSAGTSWIIRCESHVVVVAVCGCRRPPAGGGGGRTAPPVPAQTGPAVCFWATRRARWSRRGRLRWGRCVTTRGGEVMARRRCVAPLVPAAG